MRLNNTTSSILMYEINWIRIAKTFPNKPRTEFTNSINSAIAIINKYTINGHLIKDNPVLTNADVGLGNVINTAKTGLVTVGTNSTVYITIKYNNY